MKKAQAQVGTAIVVLGLLLFLGAIFFDSDYEADERQKYIDKKNSDRDQGYLVDGYYEDDFLFYLNETDIGRQKKVTESFPNFELGSEERFNIVYLGNSFFLNANPFRANTKSFDVQLSEPDDVKELLLYFNPKRSVGDQELRIRVNGELVSQNLARTSDIPIKIFLNDRMRNSSKVRISMDLIKPSWYSIFNWNKMEVSELKVVELIQDTSDNYRDFNFQVNKRDLEEVFVEITVSCEEVQEYGEPIKVLVNGYIIANSNPRCTSRYNRLSSNVSLNIITEGQNTIEFETEGYYKVAYGITKVYFNDQQVYKFNVNSFNDLIDVVMYGDFDKEVIDVRINSQTISLRRDEIEPIISYLRFGTNEIKFLNRPIEIKEFVIEKNEYID